MAQPTKQSPVKRQFLFNPLKRPMPYIGFILGILIIIFQGTIRQYTSNVVGGWLISNLKSSTQGNYTLEYDFVRFDIFTRELRMKNFELHLDTTVTTPELYLEEYSNLIDLSTPTVILKIESLWDVLVNDKLRIAYIGLERPAVNLIRSPNLTKEENQQNQQQTTEELRYYLQEVEIDSFRIVNGSVHIGLMDQEKGEILDYSVRDFSTVLKSFQLSEIDSRKPFQGIYVDQVELEVKDQLISLPKINHDITFERLWVSSRDSVIEVDTVALVPISSDSTNFRGNIALKQLSLNSLDFRKIYENFSIDMGMLKLEDLSVELSNLIDTTNADSGSSFFSKLPFSNYKIDTFQINNSAIDLQLNREIQAGKVNLEIINFSVDSADLNVQKIVDRISEFTINLEEVHAELPDSIHEAYVRAISISSASKDIILRGVRTNPIDGRRRYQLYKQQGVGFITYGNIPRLELNGIRFRELLSNQQLYADSLQIFSPSANVTQYPYIKKISSDNLNNFQYLIENITVNNGRVNFNRRQNAMNNRTELSGIDIDIKGFYPENETTPTFDQLHVAVSEGFADLNAIEHTLSFNNLTSTDLRRFDIGRLKITPDSTLSQRSSFDVTATRFSLVGYSRDFLADFRFLELEEVSAQTINARLNIVEDSVKTNKNSLDLRQLVVNRFYFNDADLNFKNGDVELEYDNLSSFVDSLNYSVYDTVSAIPIRFKDLQLSHGDFRVTAQGETKFEITGELGKFSENDSLISFSKLQYAIDNKLDGALENIEVKGFEREKFLKERILEFKYAVLDKHKMEILTKQPSKDKPAEKLTNSKIRNVLLSQFKRIDFDSLIYRNGNISLLGESRFSEFSNSNIKLVNYEFDSTTLTSDILRPEEFEINIASVTSFGENDSISISGVAMDVVNSNLMTGQVNVSASLTSGGRITSTSPGLTAKGLKLSRLIQADYSLDTILLNNTSIVLTTYDSTDNSIEISDASQEVKNSIRGLFSKSTGVKYDSTLRSKIGLLNLNKIELDSNNNINFSKIVSKLKSDLPKPYKDLGGISQQMDSIAGDTILHAPSTNGIIGFFSMANSSFSWLKNEQPHDALGELNFSLMLDHISIDTINAFNVYDHIHNINLDIQDYQFILPNDLNKLAFDRLNFSSRDESIYINNLQYIPLVDKYEYANKLGRQAGWHHLSDLDINLSHLDIHTLISEKAVHLKSITTDGGVLDIFKDKELPIPEDQYRPMLQDAIKNVKMPFLVDTLNISDFQVHFTSRLASDLPEGTLSLYEITGKSGHITNIDTLLYKNSALKISASTKIMNNGLLEANFNFNMLDSDNNFKFDAHLNSMSAEDFNSLLEATAYVKIESGDIKDIKLAASGDNYYATGKMTFQYSNLKVSTINKRNLKTTGMGKVIKTFFANAFVVRKNNPAVKFFPRVGDMFYERDTQKIIIDYVAKTAMSGVVSSIGARNFRKEIKQIKKDTRKQLDDEKKVQRKADKTSSP